MSEKTRHMQERWVQSGFLWGIVAGLLAGLLYLPERVLKFRHNLLQRGDTLRRQVDGSILADSIERGKALAREPKEPQP